MILLQFSSFYINTYQATTISALNINCTSSGILVIFINNAVWNDGVNYALNVSGYSMFGGVQINGQDANNIYKRVGDLTIVSPSTNNIIFKTNSGFWEAMRLNTTGISMNTSFYVSGTAILNNATSCLSFLDVSGATTINNAITCVSSLNVSGKTLINNQMTCVSSLNIIGTAILNNATLCLSFLNVSGTTLNNNQITCVSSLTVSGTTTINNQMTCVSSLNISGIAILNNTVSCLSSLNISGNTTMNSILIY